ncbi:MAG: hypothetical protein II272_02395 [Oscillospiraceae bacterium]|nr:hypothetical protein [Oscillospiraceae bacterium]
MKKFLHRGLSLLLAVCMVLALLPVLPFEAKAATHFHENTENKASTRASGAFYVGSSGKYVIAANVDGVYYAMSNSFASKITGTEITVTNGMVSEADAEPYAVTLTYSGGSYTIQNTTHYLTYASSTNLGASTDPYSWTIAAGVHGSWRISSTATTTRGIVFRGKTYLQFGGYALSNATASSTEYYDVEILPIGTVSGATEEVFTRVTSASGFQPGRYVILVAASNTSASYSYYALNKTEDSKNYAINVVGTSLTSVPNSITATEGLIWTISGSTSAAKIGGGDGYYLYNDPSNPVKLQYSASDSSSWKLSYSSTKGGFSIRSTYYLALRDDTTNVGDNGLPMVYGASGTSSGSAYFYLYRSENASCSHTNQTTSRVEPTCTTAGSITVSCKDCGAVISTETLAATGHSYKYTANGNGTHKITCSKCSYSSSANCTLSSGKCSYCGWSSSGGSTTGTYQLITSANQITDGNYVLIVAPGGANPGSYPYYAITRQMHSSSYVMSHGMSLSSIPASITVTNEALVWTLSGNSGGFTLTGSDGSALYNTNNNLYYGDGVATNWIATQNGNTFTLSAGDRYLGLRDDLTTVDSNGNPCFRCNTATNAKTSSYQFYLFKSGTVADPECQHSNTTTNLKEATCVETGLLTVICKDCGATVSSEVVEALGHNAQSVEGVPASCTTEGRIRHYICNRCGLYFSDLLCNNQIKESATVIPPLGHDVTAVGGIEATCGTEGMLAHYVCQGCEKYFLDAAATKEVQLTDLTIPALGHDLIETPAAPATCAASGNLRYFTCDICNAMFSDETCTEQIVLNDVLLPALNHTLSFTDGVEATCTAAGRYAHYYCAICDLYYLNNEFTEPVGKDDVNIPAMGHEILYTQRIEPACTENGLLAHYYCNRCSLIFADAAGKTVLQESDVLIAATGHNYVNGVCTSCGQSPENVDASITINHTLNLASDISINFAVKTSLLTSYDSYYLECKIPVYSGNSLSDYRTVQLQPVLNGSYYYFTLTGLTAVQIGDSIEAVLHMSKEGASYRSNTDTYSVSTYAYSQLNKANASDTLKALCANLLQYGSAAQTYKGYRTDSYADAAMTDSHRAYLTDLGTVSFNNHNVTLEDLSNPTVVWQGKSLNLDSKITIKYVVNLSSYTGRIQDLNLRVNYQDYNGNEKTAVLENIQPYGSNGSWYSFDFDGLLAAELRQVVSAAVYEGDTRVSKTLEYSADSYGNGKSGNLLQVCKAMVAYSDSALAYFKS